MGARVTLRVKGGRLQGRKFELGEAARYLIGRGPDCAVQLVGEPEYAFVSRHHCRLEVDPEGIRVRDLASRNGTYVNGQRIGQRLRGTTIGECANEGGTAYPLRDGDELSLWSVVFEIGIERSEKSKLEADAVSVSR